LYSSSGTEECWKEVEKEEALDSATGAGTGVGATTGAVTVDTGKEMKGRNEGKKWRKEMKEINKGIGFA
jgi:hypothetical protein